MYLYDDRIRAVELYIKLGKRIRATIQQLGFPTKGALRSWYREYSRRGDLKKRSRRTPKTTTIEHFIAEVDSYIRWYNQATSSASPPLPPTALRSRDRVPDPCPRRDPPS